MKKKTIDILDLLPTDAVIAVDNHGYDFLKSQGYDTDGATESEKKRQEIKKELQSKKKKLVYCGAVNSETGAIVVWFELRSVSGVEKSSGIKFLPITVEG